MRTIASVSLIVLSCGLARGQVVRLSYASFDPLVGLPPVPAALAGGGELSLVQYGAAPTEADRAGLRERGAVIERFLTDHTYVVRVSAAEAGKIAALPGVR